MSIVLAEDGWELAGQPAPEMLRAGQVSEILEGVRWTSTGLVLPANLPYERWEQIGNLLTFLEKSVQFAIGDWIRFGERTYGEKYAQAIEETPYSHGTLRNYAWVAARIELSRRNDNLPFSHHQAVAPLEVDDQERYLSLAEENGLTVRELRTLVRSVLPSPDPLTPSDALDQIGAHLESAHDGLIALSETQRLPAGEIRATLDALEGVFTEWRVLKALAQKPQRKGAPIDRAG